MSVSRRSNTTRESLPNVDLLYALMYLPLLAAGTAFAIWYELTHKAVENNYTAADTVYAIIIDVGYVSVADAGVTFGVVEGGVAIMILARRWLERMEEKREAEIAQEIAQGVAQGIAQGIAQGQAERQKKWEGWNDRRLQAQEEGREFNEPPPSLYDEENKNR